MTPAEASAGYTVTVKGKGLGGGGDQDPSIGLLFGGNGLWDKGNWWFTTNGGSNHMYSSSDAGAAAWKGGGGPLSGQDYYTRATIAAGGESVVLESSLDGSSWTQRGSNPEIAVAHGRGVGILGGGQTNVATAYDWIHVDVVPEPGSFGLAVICLVGLMMARRYSRR